MRYFCTKITQMKLRSITAYLATIVAFSFFSCSEDDHKNTLINEPQPEETETGLMVKKITQTTHFGGMGDEVSVTDFTYNDNQLTSTQTLAGGNVYGSEFHYDGFKVISVDYTRNGSADGLTTFYYNGEALNYTLSGESQEERTNYNFSNGNLSNITVYIDGTAPVLLQSSNFTYSNGNVAQEMRTSPSFGTSKLVYTYDGKNSPFKGMNKYLKLVMSNEGFDGLSASNPLTKKAYYPIDDTTPQEYYYILEYNEQNYPTLIKRYNSESDFLISETAIEYL